MCQIAKSHYIDVIMGAIAYQITSLTIDYSTFYSGADQRKHQNSVSLAFVGGIHRWPVNSPHKGPVTRKMFPFGDVIMTKVTVMGEVWGVSQCWEYLLYTEIVFAMNSLWASDAIWWHKSGSTLAQVMGCCLMAPNNCLSRCWPISSKDPKHSSEGVIKRRSEDTSR